jgi:hypothetical protein
MGLPYLFLNNLLKSLTSLLKLKSQKPLLKFAYDIKIYPVLSHYFFTTDNHRNKTRRYERKHSDSAL